jgi:NAD(P)-dependent dehydrogenase (short-subunit alcohol dehydrogenase family)
MDDSAVQYAKRTWSAATRRRTKLVIVATSSPQSSSSEKCLIPRSRLGRHYDVGRATVFLLSDQWSPYVTGIRLRVDGGLALRDYLMDP